MKIASSAQMHKIDADAINVYGIPEIVLMENAGREVATQAINLCCARQKLNFCIVAGCGNNGGDGFVAARHLVNAGHKVKVFILGNTEHFSNSTKTNYDILNNMQVEVYQIVSERDWNRLQISITFCDCLIDALLGTGIHGALRETAKKCIEILNSSNRPVLSVDIPSGVNSDTGEINPIAVKATTTVSFGLPKIGMVLHPGSFYTGKVILNTIGLPQVLLTNSEIQQEAVDQNFVESNLADRPIDVHKGSCGRVLVVAGSLGFTGAAILASSAVLRAGAGISTLASAEGLYDILASKATEVMTQPLPEIAPGILGESALKAITDMADKYNTILIGPGLGRNEETCKLVRKLATSLDKPLIIDADGIYAFSLAPDELKNIKQVPILTPHLGEMANLLHISINDLKANLWDVARKAANYFNAIFVLKSDRTLVAYPDGNIFVTTVGNAGMATAGSGDVLAGTIAGIVAEGLAKDMAAPVGMYLHGLAGDLAAKQGQAGLIASDILQNLPKARLTVGKK